MKIYTKKEIQQRVLKNGKPLSLNKFCWDGKSKTFSSNEDGLVVDFANMDSATIKCGYSATIDCWNYATINCGDSATINCGDSATIDCGGRECVIIRRDEFEVIKPDSGDIIQTCPYMTKGHIKNGLLNK